MTTLGPNVPTRNAAARRTLAQPRRSMGTRACGGRHLIFAVAGLRIVVLAAAPPPIAGKYLHGAALHWLYRRLRLGD
jgi:hypothetical protein